jgi:hypothetical protein
VVGDANVAADHPTGAINGDGAQRFPTGIRSLLEGLSMRVRGALAAVLVVGAVLVLPAASAGAVSPDIVISQVYGGGGNAGAPFTNDFVELFNRGSAPVSVAGWSVQYASANGTNWIVTPLAGTIPAGRCFLVQQSGGSAGASLPAANVTGTTSMSATAGKVALSGDTTPFSGSTPSGVQLRDLLGYGATTGYEGASPAPAPSSATADLRLDGGCSDGDNNGADFVSDGPAPRNSASPVRACHDVVISQVYGGGGNAGAPFQNDYVELFNRSPSPVNVTGWSVQYAAPTGSAWSVTVLSGTIPASGYFLVQEASGGGSGAALPLANSVGNVNLGSSDGKVALVSNSVALSGAGPSGSGVRDFLGYGAADAFIGTAPAPPPSNTVAIGRAGQGCTDTGDNGHDFTVVTPSPRTSSSSAHLCGGATPTRGVGDFDGNGTTDIAVFRPPTGTWFVKGGATVGFGVSTDVPVAADFDGNGSADIAVFRPSSGGWYRNGAATTFFGGASDLPVPADYDGNGAADIAVFRPATGGWYRPSVTTFFGLSGDIPVPGDYDANGSADLAVFRPSVGGWYRAGAPTVFFGLSGDIPVPGDYDGNGTTDIAVFRPSVGGWYVQGKAPVFLGLNGDIPVPGDYDGNGTTDLAVFRPATGQWFVQGQPPVSFGVNGDRPLPLPSAIRQAFFP